MQQAQRDQRAPLRRFAYSRKGYEISEVDQFVTEVGRQLGLAHQRVQPRGVGSPVVRSIMPTR